MLLQRGLRPEIPPFVPEQCCHQHPKQQPEFSKYCSCFQIFDIIECSVRRSRNFTSLSILSMSTSRLTWCELVYWDCTLKHMDLVKCKCHVIITSALSMLEIMKSQMNQNKTKP